MKALYDLPAPAKLNLFLHVVGRRADGYHRLQSAFVLIDWADTLHLEKRADGRILRHDLGPPLPEDDLCLRAARLLQAEAGTAQGVDISIHKRVPSGAGMGGGSSDAATVLLGLNRLWGLNRPRAWLLPLALKLGADVPFFVGGTDAFVEGIGEVLRPIHLPRQWYAVVKPAASLPTAAIFTHPALTRDTEAVIVEGSLEDAPQVAAWSAGWGRNDLQPVAEALCSEVAQAARCLEQVYGHSRMTGSGSAVFSRAGAEGSPVAMPTALQDLAGAAGWEARMCRGLGEHPLRGFAD
ncbi:MAG: 4-(cytidine 5'-diphospho)-2-C-methyl-D-erythritol kinase [Rubrivivax sp.]